MATFIFAARNSRKKHSTKAEGDATRKAELSPDYRAKFVGDSMAAEDLAALASDLKKKARLETSDAIMAAHLTAAYSANPVANDTTAFSERVGKSVIQIGYGTGATNAAAEAAIVWFDLS